jgi:hypothetical protein
MLQVKAWIRRVKHLLQQPQLSEIGHRVRYKIIDGKGQLLHSGSSAIGKWGGIALQFKLPYHAPVGQASIHFTSDLKDVANVTARQVFAIKDHRPPQRMIKVWPTTRGPYVAGEAISLRLQAALAAEQPLSHTEVSWRIVAEQKAFAPLQHRNFLFGNHLLSADASTRELAYHQLYRTKTDSYGQCNLRIKFEAPAVHTPMYVTVRGEIPKLHNASTALHQASRLGLQPVSFLLHPASYYVGLRTERVFVERGNALTVEAIVTDLSGRLISAVPISITATRLSANSQICKVISSTSEASRCNFQTTQGGIYEIKAVISDPKGRRHATVLRRWVLDPMMTIPAETNALHKIKLLANREFYQLGDIARIVVRTANYPRHGLLLLHNGNIFLRRQFYMTGSMIEFNLPIERKHIPHFYACAYFSATSGVNLQNSKGNLAQTAMTDLRAGDVTTSCIRIDVPPVEHKLSLMLHTNHDNVEQQGAVTSLNIDVRYSNGVPVPNAEIALLAAREAKLSPTSCNFSEPLASFYAPTSAKLGVTRFKSTMSLFGAGDIAEKLLHRPLAKAYRAMSNSIAHKSLNYKYNSNRSWLYKDPIQLMPKMPADMQIEDPLGFALHTTCGGRSIDKGNHPKTKFLFLPSISTDEKGRAEVRLQLPLSFAKYHILAVAAAGDAHFGSTIHTIQAAKRLQIISAMPRYLHRGDLFDLPVILHNPTDRSIEVNLVARATGLTWRSANSLKVQVPARQRVQLKLPFTADHTNTAHLQIGAFWEQHNEVKEFTITLLAKNDETAITSGVIAHRGGISLPLQLPPDAITETGGLEFRAMTSAVLHLEELWKQLQTHRAGTEPSASRLLAALSLLRLPPQLRTPAFQPKHLRLTVRREVLGLSVLQNNDGGFPLWQRGDDSWPFVSIHVSHALLQARLAGFAIPPNTLRNALLHLEQLERVIPKHYPQHIRQKLLAYRWNVLHLAVRSKIWRERKSYKNIAIGKIAFKNMPLEAIAWLYPMFAEQPDAISNTKQIRQILRSKIKISVDKAGFVCNQQSSGQLVMFSPQRTSALILKGLLRDLNRDPMIPQLAQGLVSLSNQTRHRDTQTCVWTILALTRYLRNYRTPIHHAQVKLWLGKHLVINSNMRPNITGSQNIFVPIKKLWDVGTKSDLLLHKSGNGPLHYQIKLALNTQKTLGGDHYMTITRQYLAAEPSSNIHRKPDGSLQIKVGTILKVQLKIKICSPRYHIALRDFIPAGFTVISEGDAYSSAALSTNDPATSMPTSQCAINAPKPWFDYRLLQREQIELCALALETGVYHYSYLIRADFTGNFAAPAPNISESHNPKNYARYHSTHITIAD